MSGLKSIAKGLNRKKVKVFLLFLFCSFLAWAVSKLSETYESRTFFEVSYQNVPDTLLANQGPPEGIRAKIKASGFQSLAYAMNPKTVKIDLKNMLEQDGNYFLTANNIKEQLESQLPSRISLLEIGNPVYYTNLYRVATKKVPIVPEIELSLSQNHILKGKINVNPDSAQIKGPKKILDGISEIKTSPIELKEVSEDFTSTLGLVMPDSITNVLTKGQKVTIAGEVVRFSEKEFEVDLTAVNVPEGYRLRMFPDKVKLICKAGLTRLKTLQPIDFKAFVDYKAVVDNKFLYVETGEDPSNVFSVRLLNNRVEFVLEKL